MAIASDTKRSPHRASLTCLTTMGIELGIRQANEINSRLKLPSS